MSPFMNQKFVADKNRVYQLITTICVSCTMFGVSAAPVRDTDRTVHQDFSAGNSACAKKNLPKLKSTVFSMKIKDRSAAWKGIQIILCSDVNETDVRFISDMLANRITKSLEGTGQDPSIEEIKKSDVAIEDILAMGKASDAEISNSAGKIELFYSFDEVCIASRKFQYIRKKWRIVSIGQACD